MATRRVPGSRAPARAAAAALPRGRRLDLLRLAPSGPSLLAGFTLIALALASYGVARETPLFEIRTIHVVGAGEAQQRVRVERALEPLLGRSLVGFRAEELDRRIATLSDVAGASYDREFPHTLRVVVAAERPLHVLRRGAESWLVSARARVVRELPRGALPALPRVWVQPRVEVEAGRVLTDAGALRAVAVLAHVSEDVPFRVRVLRFDGEETTLVLRSGLELRLGREHELELKLAVAGELVPRLRGGNAAYLDLAVPDRPVVGYESQAQVEADTGPD